MEKQQTRQTDHDQMEGSLRGRDERVEDVESEPVQHVHLKTIVLLIVSFPFLGVLPRPLQQYPPTTYIY